MSSSGGNRKSMDDVLSSIRRIIGSEKKEGYDDMPDRDPAEDSGPMTLGAPISEGRPQAAAPESPAGEPDPLSLTPNMRVDFTKLAERDERTRIGGPAPQPEAMPGAAEAVPAEDAPEPYSLGEDDDDEAVVIDEAALEDMIRRIVREELEVLRETEEAARADAEAAAASERQEEMRSVVREELMGETGKNISRNVQKLIQAEVTRLLAERG
ncbi:hypothetical protein LNKW23_28210 [Paralimibaculum aggregatum]|uniref:DUF2497 domain-containing protein n=1 Tax=Paralimibaculum aggregatum TaxID=3036245 RepID=A0ABQ6LQ72_9RHOB|nr:hypothetical protein [Limibaculum sp. NKW23]GMG83608.1 hypothetical protein LNKW23_28210 [Limibaculum sp. NKW23]